MSYQFGEDMPHLFPDDDPIKYLDHALEEFLPPYTLSSSGGITRDYHYNQYSLNENEGNFAILTFIDQNDTPQAITRKIGSQTKEELFEYFTKVITSKNIKGKRWRINHVVNDLPLNTVKDIRKVLGVPDEIIDITLVDDGSTYIRITNEYTINYDAVIAQVKDLPSSEFVIDNYNQQSKVVYRNMFFGSSADDLSIARSHVTQRNAEYGAFDVTISPKALIDLKVLLQHDLLTLNEVRNERRRIKEERDKQK